MHLNHDTLTTIERTLRVDTGAAEPLSDLQVEEVLEFVRHGSMEQGNSFTLVLAVQALMFSARPRKAAEALIHRAFQPLEKPIKSSDQQIIGQALDVALFDTYRQADPLEFEFLHGQVEKQHVSMDALAESIGDGSRNLSREQRNFLSFNGRVLADIFVPLLNTEHQGDVARVLEKFLNILLITGTDCIDSSRLLAMVQRSYTPPRTVFEPTALGSLRKSAVAVSARRVSESPNFPSQNAKSARLSTFRFLLFSGNVDRQLAVLRTMAAEARTYAEPEAANNLVNCLCWAHETTLDEDVSLLVEKLFLESEVLAETHQYLAMATRFGDRARGERWINKMANNVATTGSRYLEAKFWLHFAEPDRAMAAASKPLSVLSKGKSIETMSPKRYAKQVIRKYILRRSMPSARGLVHPSVLYNLVRTAQEAKFLGDLQSFSANARAGRARKDNNTTVVVVCNHLNFLTQMPVAAIEHARNEGAEIVSFVNGTYPASETLSASATKINNVLVPPYYFHIGEPSHAVSPDWTIDPANRRFIYKGMNYYHGIQNSIGIIFRRFEIDYDSPLESTQLRRHLVLFQNMHDTFDDFIATMDPARQYQFLVAGVQFGVGYGIRMLVSNAALPNVRVIHASNGFEAFDASWQIDPESTNALASYHSVADLTDTPNTPLGFRPRPSDCVETIHNDFDSYRNTNPVVAAYFDKIDGRLEIARKKHRPAAHQKRRVLMLGTILPDLSIPQDHGFIHTDIAHWVRHTAQIAESEDFTLVVKQHPAELNHKIGFYVSQPFADLVPEGAPNVEILPYDVGFHEAVLDADLVILWGGTSTIELAAMDCPYIACSRFAQEEYPLFAESYETDKEYRDMLAGRRAVLPPVNGRLRAADIVHRISTSPLREVSAWPKRQLLNAQTWPPRIDPDLASSLVDEPSTKRLAERILGKPKTCVNSTKLKG